MNPDQSSEAPASVALVYRIARRSLLGGFAVSAALIVSALVMAAISGQPIGSDTLPVSDIFSAMGEGDPTSFAQLAIFAVVLSPIVSALGIMIGFFRIGDRTYAGVSLLVLIVLSASMLIGLFV